MEREIMKIGDKILVRRLENGMYCIEIDTEERKIKLIGAAPSTAIALITEVFKAEASGT